METLKAEQESSLEKEPNVNFFITENGTRYDYMSDDRIQRTSPVKSQLNLGETRVEGSYDACVFLPDYESIKKLNPSEFNINPLRGKNEKEYVSSLDRYLKSPNFKGEIVDKNGKRLNNDKEIKTAEGYAYLALAPNLKLPVAKRPRKGFYPFVIAESNNKTIWVTGGKINNIGDQEQNTRKEQEALTGTEKEWDSIDTVITAKGSSYKYLPNGTTQRFKKVENEYHEPQDALVYIPDYEWLRQNYLPQLEKIYGKKFDGEGEYVDFILKYINNDEHIMREGKIMTMVENRAMLLKTNADIAKARKQGRMILLALCNENKTHFAIPVSHSPTEGFYTYDTKHPKEGTVLRKTEHLGNKVVRIIKKQS